MYVVSRTEAGTIPGLRLTFLQELFRRIGPITKLQLRYDRSGRSEGVAFVTYEEREDAMEAVKQFDGANANGTFPFDWLMA